MYARRTATKTAAPVIATAHKHWHDTILPAFKVLNSLGKQYVNQFDLHAYDAEQNAPLLSNGADAGAGAGAGAGANTEAVAWDSIAAVPPTDDAKAFIKWFDDISTGVATIINLVDVNREDYNINAQDLAVALNASAQHSVDTLTTSVIGVLQQRKGGVLAMQAACMWLQGKSFNLSLMDNNDTSSRVGTLMQIIGTAGDKKTSKDRMAAQRQRTSIEACRTIHRFNKTAVLLWMTLASTGAMSSANKALAFLDRLDDHIWLSNQLPSTLALRPTHLLAVQAKPKYAEVNEATGHRVGFTVVKTSSTKSPYVDSGDAQKAKGYAPLKTPQGHKPTAAPVGDKLVMEGKGYSSANDTHRLITKFSKSKGIGVFNAGDDIPAGTIITTCVGQLKLSHLLSPAERQHSVDLAHGLSGTG
jgi:hypothetical protein